MISSLLGGIPWYTPILKSSPEERFGGPGEFADGFPFLLTSEEALADLNANLPGPHPVTRFRHLVVPGRCALRRGRVE
jgi:uncharacterized protein YcbX